MVRTERGCVGLPTSRSATDNPEGNGIFAAAAADSSSLRSSEHSRAPKNIGRSLVCSISPRL